MIELTPLARPYAKALFASANESKNLDSLAEELKIMASVSKTEGVINTIENPVLSRKEVVSILVNLFEESVSDTSKKLLEILHTFVATGNTVVVIEHNLDVIKTADHVVDMGPDGGVKGGQVIAEGKPEDICNTEKSYTGKFLKPLLNSKFKKIA